MMYIIGRTQVFEKAIKRYGEEYQKMGSRNATEKGVKSIGGLVFETQEQAQAYIQAYKLEDSHSVYGIEATKDDVEVCKFGPWYTLLNSCRVKKIT